MDCNTPGLPLHHQLPEFTQMSTESVMPSNHLILCWPLLLRPSIFPSIKVFSNESVLRTRWPMYWSFSFSTSPSNENSGLISFRMDWLDFLAVQGTLKSLLQHHSSKASILWCSTFFIVQLSHPYVTTGISHKFLNFKLSTKVRLISHRCLVGLMKWSQSLPLMNKEEQSVHHPVQQGLSCNPPRLSTYSILWKEFRMTIAWGTLNIGKTSP